EARGNDDGTANSGIDALRDDAWHGCRRRDHDSQIHSLRNLRHPLVSLDSQNAAAAFTDGINRAPEWTAYQAPQHSPSNAPDALGCANHGNAVWGENRIEGMRLRPQDIVRAIM